MVNAYRDDLEAAQQRADGLERELAEVRTRNRALEQQLAEMPVQTRELTVAASSRRAIEWLERKFPVSRPERASPWLAAFGVVLVVMATESKQYVIAAITAAVVLVVLGAMARERKES